MINQTILFLPHTDCVNVKLKPYTGELGINVNWNPDLNLGVPLSKVFKHVIRFDIGKAYCNDGVILANKKIIELVKKHSPKYVIWPTMTYEILEETFQEIRKSGAYVIGWFFDDEVRFDSYSSWWVPYMDYIFTADKSSVARYQRLGAKAYHLLVTGEPDDFKPLKADANYEISFVGSKHVADRESLIKRFYNDGIFISTFGRGWANGFISHDKMAQIFYNSKINICFTKAGADVRNQLKGKIFDITMCGGFLLCEYVEGIEDFFEIGKEIVCFDNYVDALEKINHYLINNEERKRIAEAGKLRAILDLAQHKLFEKVFTAIESDIETNAERNIMTVSILQMPKSVRIAHSQYHLRWTAVLKKVGFEKKYWRDEYKLVCKYTPIFARIKFKYKYLGSVIYLIKVVRNKIKIRTRILKLFNKKQQHMINKIKKFTNIIINSNRNNQKNNQDDNAFLLRRIMGHALPSFLDFYFDKLKTDTLNFVESMKIVSTKFEYKYSPSCKSPNIYSSAYACMIFSMFNKLDELTADEKNNWAQYFNTFQSSKDGLFYDKSLQNENYNDSDWWGARHLALHLINVYVALEAKPRHPFLFLKKYYDLNFLKNWLDKQNWLEKFTRENDIDNKIMNITAMLQYQRDFWQDKKAEKAVSFIQKYLEEKINPDTGMWGYFDIDNKHELSRMVQFAYHLLPMYFYDNIEIKNKKKIIDNVLKTQNIYGGFGVELNSSACEDIDSIDILIRFSKLTEYRKKEIDIALKKAFIWVLANQNDDGGYVFRRNESMFYGHEQMNSEKNESAMFPTWFRTLTIAYLANHLEKKGFNIIKTHSY